MRMVRWINGTTPSFNTHPLCFTIPGQSFFEAHDFVEAMQATVRWNLDNTFYNKALSLIKKPGRPATFFFKLYYECPRSGFHKAPINSRKAPSGRKCGCKARFTVTHHIATNSLRVDWFWKHSHELNTKEDMENTRIPKVVHDWIVARVDSGLGWKGIRRLLLSRDLDA
ncbi:hypothetical protein PTTG_30944, partial [Puccinia triticina 1-1 BBBD Race 1]